MCTIDSPGRNSVQSVATQSSIATSTESKSRSFSKTFNKLFRRSSANSSFSFTSSKKNDGEIDDSTPQMTPHQAAKLHKDLSELMTAHSSLGHQASTLGAELLEAKYEAEELRKQLTEATSKLSPVAAGSLPPLSPPGQGTTDDGNAITPINGNDDQDQQKQQEQEQQREKELLYLREALLEQEALCFKLIEADETSTTALMQTIKDKEATEAELEAEYARCKHLTSECARYKRIISDMEQNSGGISTEKKGTNAVIPVVVVDTTVPVAPNHESSGGGIGGAGGGLVNKMVVVVASAVALAGVLAMHGTKKKQKKPIVKKNDK